MEATSRCWPLGEALARPRGGDETSGDVLRLRQRLSLSLFLQPTREGVGCSSRLVALDEVVGRDDTVWLLQPARRPRVRVVKMEEDEELQSGHGVRNESRREDGHGHRPESGIAKAARVAKKKLVSGE